MSVDIRRSPCRGSASTASLRYSRYRGFTLIEVVVTLSISALLVGFVALLVTTPVDAYVEQTERARLADSAEAISRRFAQDLTTALPRSVRIDVSGSRTIIEFLKVEAVSFYAPPGTPAFPDRDFDGTPDDRFYALGISAMPAAARYLVTGHLGTAGANAYDSDGVITPDFEILGIAAPGALGIQVENGFAFSSPDISLNRLFFVSGPVTYICNTSAGLLTRFANYSIADDIAASESDPQLGDGQSEVIASDVTSCRAECEGMDGEICEHMLVFEAHIRRIAPPDDETIRILEQVPLDNRPLP